MMTQEAAANVGCHFLAAGFVLIGIVIMARGAVAEPTLPAPTPGTGTTLYVSKLGDNSDGSSWVKAFTTIQAALLAVPNDKGGHRIIVRPDTYMEANLYPSQMGAAGAYNVLEGDTDGRLGSGATGNVVIDSGDPEKGFKSYDWWGVIRAYSKGWSAAHTEETFSAIGWDRWVLRRLYATGGDGGLFWDCTNRVEPFTVVVEDCISIGRAFGGGVGNCLARADEPIVFRRCHLWALDWWGDTAGAYVRIENKTMPDHPEVFFEDCTLAGPQCAFKASNFGFTTYTHAKLTRCNLIALNFSQPQGTPIDGVIQSVEEGKYLSIDLEDCAIMGYKVFGVRVNKDTEKDLRYTVTGRVRAYVQFQQAVPEGMERVTAWPVDVFAMLLPQSAAKLTKLPVFYGEQAMESTPFLYKDRPMLMMSRRQASSTPDIKDMYLFILDLDTGKEVARFAEGHSFGSAFVNGDEVNVWASEYTTNDWTQDLYRFSTTDLKTWKRKLAIARDGDEHLFNTSVCRDEQGYLMAYESNKPVSFCFKFARSKDLVKWEKLDGLIFTGTGAEYSACPVIRYLAPYYYVIYLHAAIEGHNGWVSFMARSKDLITWELSPRNPILEASAGEGSNNSDVDLFEWQGNTYIYYATGDQATWGKLGCALYPGPLQAFYESYFPEGAPMIMVTTKK